MLSNLIDYQFNSYKKIKSQEVGGKKVNDPGNTYPKGKISKFEKERVRCLFLTRIYGVTVKILRTPGADGYGSNSDSSSPLWFSVFLSVKWR